MAANLNLNPEYDATARVLFEHSNAGNTERLEVTIFGAMSPSPMVIVEGTAAALMRLRDMIDNALRRGIATTGSSEIRGGIMGIRHKEHRNEHKD